MQTDPLLTTLASLAEGLDNKKSLEEVVKAFELIIEFAQKTYNLTQKEIENLQSMFVEARDELKAGNIEKFDTLKARVMSYCEEEMSKITKSHKEMMQKCDDKLAEVKDGQDADEERVIEEVIARLGERKKSEPEDLEETPNDVIDTINKADNLINIERIGELNGIIKRLEDQISSIPRGSRVGGTSAIGVAQAFKYIAHTERPSGAIDGNNTSYTVKNNIWWIAGFTLNGEQIAQLPNFTYSGRTITFATALPVDYSGSDFEIKYIGS